MEKTMEVLEVLADSSGLLSGPRLSRLLGYDTKTNARMAREERSPQPTVGGRVHFNPQAVGVWLTASQTEVK